MSHSRDMQEWGVMRAKDRDEVRATEVAQEAQFMAGCDVAARSSHAATGRRV